jgi:hypothetical protein
LSRGHSEWPPFWARILRIRGDRAIIILGTLRLGSQPLIQPTQPTITPTSLDPSLHFPSADVRSSFQIPYQLTPTHRSLQTMLTIKSRMDTGDIRRFKLQYCGKVTPELLLERCVHFHNGTLNLGQKWQLFWEDADGDLVTIASQDDLDQVRTIVDHCSSSHRLHRIASRRGSSGHTTSGHIELHAPLISHPWPTECMRFQLLEQTTPLH